MQETGIRSWVGLVVAADSPAGLAHQAINELTRHLPDPDAPDTCPTCGGGYWPCPYFDDAVFHLQAAHVRIGDVLPPDVHARRRLPAAPSTPQDQPAWPAEPPHGENDRG